MAAMSDIQTADAAPSRSPILEDLEPLAACALDAVISLGANILVREPWRVARIVRGADGMTVCELRAYVARRRRAEQPADLNRVIALAQLSLALQAPAFAAAWADWRSQAAAE